MSYHTHTSLLFHYVFTTKNRIPSIPQELQARLWAYMGGIARANKMKALAVGGIADHSHVLLSLPPTITVAKAISSSQPKIAAIRRFCARDSSETPSSKDYASP